MLYSLMPPLDKEQLFSNRQNYCNFEILQFCNGKVLRFLGRVTDEPCPHLAKATPSAGLQVPLSGSLVPSPEDACPLL